MICCNEILRCKRLNDKHLPCRSKHKFELCYRNIYFSFKKNPFSLDDFITRKFLSQILLYARNWMLSHTNELKYHQPGIKNDLKVC
jgi:hypothetical protein